MTDSDALSQLLRNAIRDQHAYVYGERFKPVFEDADARSFKRPYDPHVSGKEKAARKAWYKSQLPPNMPKKGTVRVSYLYRCEFPTFLFGGAEPGEISDDDLAVADRTWITMAMESEGLQVPDLSQVTRQQANGSDGPASGLRELNRRLIASSGTGGAKLVLDPYCGPSFPDEHMPPPPPPPPPPPRSPVTVQKTPGTSVYIASAYRAELCRLKTGSPYRSDCKGWWEVLTNQLQLGGTSYRYVIIRGGRIVKSGPLDLDANNGVLELVVS